MMFEKGSRIFLFENLIQNYQIILKSQISYWEKNLDIRRVCHQNGVGGSVNRVGKVTQLFHLLLSIYNWNLFTIHNNLLKLSV